MKKMFFLVFSCLGLQLFAQHNDGQSIVVNPSKNEIQEVSAGFLWGTFASHYFNVEEHYDERAFFMEPMILASVNLYTHGSYHEFIYDLGENSIGMINGIFFGHKKWGSYFLMAKELSAPHFHVAIGFERFFVLEGKEDPFLHTKIKPSFEIGFSSEKDFILSLGVLMSTQFVISK